MGILLQISEIPLSRVLPQQCQERLAISARMEQVIISPDFIFGFHM